MSLADEKQKLEEGFASVGFGFFGCKIVLDYHKDEMHNSQVWTIKLWAPDMWLEPPDDGFGADGFADGFDAAFVKYAVSRMVPSDELADMDEMGILEMFRDLAHQLVTGYVDETISYKGMRPFATIHNESVS